MKKLILFLAFAFPLLAQINVLVFAGSTRKDSMNKKLAMEAAAAAKQAGAHVTLIDLKDYAMPFYDADVESKGLPKNVKRFRDLMVAADAVIIASPEYNSSIPAVLKNALDWASRADGSSPSAFAGKKFAIMSASPGRMGGARGLVHLRSVIEDAGGEVLKQQTAVAKATDDLIQSVSVRKQVSEELAQLFQD